MKTNQMDLISRFGMTSTRKMNAVHRARALAGFSNKSSSTIGGKSVASTAAAPVRKPSFSRAVCLEKQDEMTLRGENRWYGLTSLDHCPDCGHKPVLEVIWINQGLHVPRYRVRCECKKDFPVLPSSQDAIQHWKLSVKLSTL